MSRFRYILCAILILRQKPADRMSPAGFLSLDMRNTSYSFLSCPQLNAQQRACSACIYLLTIHSQYTISDSRIQYRHKRPCRPPSGLQAGSGCRRIPRRAPVRQESPPSSCLPVFSETHLNPFIFVNLYCFNLFLIFYIRYLYVS